MSRWIDAEWLEELFPDTGEGEWTYNATVLGYIDSAPTIDAVSVVRCKDCKHCYEDGEHVKFNVCELNHNKVQSDDWYCADGERKGE